MNSFKLTKLPFLSILDRKQGHLFFKMPQIQQAPNFSFNGGILSLKIPFKMEVSFKVRDLGDFVIQRELETHLFFGSPIASIDNTASTWGGKVVELDFELVKPTNVVKPFVIDPHFLIPSQNIEKILPPARKVRCEIVCL